MDQELREAERRWQAFYSGKEYRPKPTLVEPGELDGWEIAGENKNRIWDRGTHEWIKGRQETWGNPMAAEKAAKRYIRRMGYSAQTAIKVVRIGPYKFQPRVKKGRLVYKS